MKTKIKTVVLFILLICITSSFTLAQSRRSSRSTNSSLSSSEEIPPHPERREGESQDAYAERVVSWQQEVRRIAEEEKFRLQQESIREQQMREREERKLEERAQVEQELLEMASKLDLFRGNSTNNTGSENVLIIPTGEIDTEELLTINEDMNVMWRILQNKLSHQPKAIMGEWSLLGGQWVPNYESILGRSTNNTINSMYLQNYGALFIMKVDFTLSGLPNAQEQQEEKVEEDVDHVWEDTRRQIYEPQVSSIDSRRRTTNRQEVKYDAEKVETLKTTLIESLKHAANIRALKQGDSVILRINGGSRSIRVLSVQNREDGMFIAYESDGVNNTTVTNLSMDDFIRSLSTPRCIVIRAKKFDIDAFAKEELDFEQFREKVQIFSYPLLNGNVTGTSNSRGRTTLSVPPVYY